MRIAWLAIIYTILSLLPLALESIGVSRLVSILAFSYIMSIYALSFALLLGYLGLLNFGHALFFGLGAYLTAYQTIWWGIPYVLVIPISMIFGAAAGFLLSLIVRRAFGGIPFAFITLTVLLMVYFLYTRRELRAISGSEQGLLIPTPQLLTSTIISYIPLALTAILITASIYTILRSGKSGSKAGASRSSIAIIPLSLILMSALILLIDSIANRAEPLRISINLYILSLTTLIAVHMAIKKILESPLGLIWISIRENESRAASLGYNVFIYKAIAMSISGAIAAVSGSLYAVYAFNINPERTFSPLLSVYGLIYSLIGGLYPIEGSIIGAIVVTIIERFIADYAGGWSLVFVGVLFITIVLTMPHGIAYYIWNPSTIKNTLKVLKKAYRSTPYKK
ncbi:MAG: branched-chain amino acid ABC transporter permease [Sulfolobales archaeon]